MITSSFRIPGLRFALTLALVFAVEAPASQALALSAPDTWITAKAKIALVTQSHALANDIHVDTAGGRVILYGKVATDAQRRSAAVAVQAIQGVRNVRNLLQVVPPAVRSSVSISDDRIKDDVTGVLREDPFLADSSISVKSVDRGTVLLTGRAKNLYAHWSAVSSASSVPGVVSVATEITVPDETATEIDLSRHASGARDAIRDAWTTAEVKLRLLADSEVPALDVGVDTSRGVVSLVGSVPTPGAKAAAIADAQRVDAVISVNDDLQVRPGSPRVTPARDEAVKVSVDSVLKGTAAFKDINADVKEGRVHLTGKVASGWVRLQAATAIRAVQGVRSVDDDLQVGPTNG